METSICKAVRKDGTRCVDELKTNNWCEHHSKKLMKKYFRYKLLEHQADKKVETKDEIRYQYNILIKVIALRKQLRAQGFSPEFQDSGHLERIKNLKHMCKNLIAKYNAITGPSTLETEPETENEHKSVFIKNVKQTKKFNHKPKIFREQDIDYTSMTTYNESLIKLLQSKNLFDKDIDTQSSICRFAYTCVIKGIIEDIDASILQFLETKFKGKAVLLYNLCKTYVRLFDEALYSLEKRDPDNKSPYYSRILTTCNCRISEDLEFELYVRLSVKNHLTKILGADITSKYIEHFNTCDNDRWEGPLNFNFCLFLALRGVKKIILKKEGNAMVDFHVDAPPHVIKKTELNYPYACDLKMYIHIKPEFVEKTLKTLGHPTIPEYMELLFYLSRKFNKTNMIIVTAYTSKSIKIFMEKHCQDQINL